MRQRYMEIAERRLSPDDLLQEAGA